VCIWHDNSGVGGGNARLTVIRGTLIALNRTNGRQDHDQKTEIR
jgi:hypothetical protein